MALLLRDFAVDISEDEARLPLLIADDLGLSASQMRDFIVVRRRTVKKNHSLQA